MILLLNAGIGVFIPRRLCCLISDRRVPLEIDPTIDVDSLDGESEVRLMSAAYLRILVGLGLDIP